jgi:hypothetical protein
MEARDAAVLVFARPLRPKQLVARGPAIREGLKERVRKRTAQLTRYPWEHFLS